MIRRALPRLTPVLIALCGCSAAAEDGVNLLEADGGVAATDIGVNRAPLQSVCTIVLEQNGVVTTLSQNLDAGQSATWPSLTTASGIIRSTSGLCHFRVYNGNNFTGPSVVIGSELNGKIRAGVDGLQNKDSGGGDTWLVRSVWAFRVSDVCQVSIGGGGIRMKYFVDEVNAMPSSDRISWMLGGDCEASAWNGLSFGASDGFNRFKALHPNSGANLDYDPGYRVRSISVVNNGNTCPAVARDNGRCLPQMKFPSGGHLNDPGNDGDADGLNDFAEDWLAGSFAPAYFNDSSENGTRTNIYTDAGGNSVMEPATIFSVKPDGPLQAKITFMKMWRNDVHDCALGGLGGCCGHPGDTQANALYVRTTPTSSPDSGNFWYVWKVDSGDDADWSQGDGSIRGAHFVKGPNETGIANHVAIHFSRGKHHEYNDDGWSGETDLVCGGPTNSITAEVNSRGQSHSPAYPMRIANLHSPSGKGDIWGATNVGSKTHRFFTDLAPYGFPGECLWDCGKFYSDDAGPPGDPL